MSAGARASLDNPRWAAPRFRPSETLTSVGCRDIVRGEKAEQGAASLIARRCSRIDEGTQSALAVIIRIAAAPPCACASRIQGGGGGVDVRPSDADHGVGRSSRTPAASAAASSWRAVTAFAASTDLAAVAALDIVGASAVAACSTFTTCSAGPSIATVAAAARRNYGIEDRDHAADCEKTKRAPAATAATTSAPAASATAAASAARAGTVGA